MKAWLCLNPVKQMIAELDLLYPPECLGCLAVYKTKKLGRSIHGPKAQFMEVDWPKEKDE